MMTVNEFMDYAIDPCFEHVRIWDCAKEDCVFDGYITDMPDEYLNATVRSWNSTPVGIELNIDSDWED